MQNEIINKVCILVSCPLLVFWAGVLGFGYPGIMNSYWKEEFHVGNSETGLVITFMMVAVAISMFISGRIYAKMGLYFCIVAGTVFYSVAFLFLFLAKSIVLIYIWGLLVNFGFSFLYGPSLTTIQTAFPNKRGLVSGFLNFVLGISAAIMSPILNSTLNGKGYTFTNILVFILIIVSNVLAFFLLIFSNKNKTKKMNNIDTSKDLTVKEALKTKEFWALWLLWAFMGAAGISMVSLSKTYSVVIGETSVIILTIFNLANGICRLFIGWFTDRIGGRFTGAISFLLTTVGYLVMPHTSNVTLICICAVGVGIGLGALFTVSGPLTSLIFGFKEFGMIFGLLYTGYGIIGGVVGPFVSGLVLEKTNDNYIIVFTYLGIMAFIGFLSILIVNDKKKESKSSTFNKEKSSNMNLIEGELNSIPEKQYENTPDGNSLDIKKGQLSNQILLTSKLIVNFLI